MSQIDFMASFGNLIGSVTAEIIERSHTTVLAIPENTPFNRFNEVKRIVQQDLRYQRHLRQQKCSQQTA